MKTNSYILHTAATLICNRWHTDVRIQGLREHLRLRILSWNSEALRLLFRKKEQAFLF